MPYDSLTERADAQALSPEDAAELIEAVPEASAVATHARQLPTLSRNQRRIPVWSTMPHAYFVDGDTGIKQTSDVAWDNVYLNVEEIAVIVPVPEAVLDDSEYMIFEEAKPHIVTAAGKLLDQAVLYGTNAPASWPTSIAIGANNAGHYVVAGSVGDIYDDIMGVGGVLNKVEEDGFFVNGHLAALNMKARLRGLREKDAGGNLTGQPIFMQNMADRTSYSLDGEPLSFPRNGAIDPAQSLMISGDWSQLVWAIRQDITWKVLDQAVITDGSKNIVYNLAQQDMVALRMVFRAGWALPNPINHVNPDPNTRYPFAVLSSGALSS